MSKLSMTAHLILHDHYGYRNNNYGCGGSRDSKEVIEYECFELDNDDIPDFCERYSADIKGYDKLDKRQRVDAIKKQFCKEYPYAIWLTGFNEVKTEYLYLDQGDSPTDISCYDLSKIKYMIVSDLGIQGVLFLLNVHPETIRKY